jgi:very-short-patch-repair endonuclease
MALHFGPLNRAGGERRLNVAVTRAREKLLVVTSIRAGDLDVSATRAAGVRQLHRYLDYAERGAVALEQGHPQGLGEPESPLETDVRDELRRMGFEVASQVGCSGYRIDLGVVDPAAPGRFLLGVECDGATYHSAATARDRDRLRHEVLESLGWRLHRIWSPDWSYRRAEEIERLRQALEKARQEQDGLVPPVPAAGAVAASSTRKIEISTPEDNGQPFPGTEPYRVCKLKVAQEVADLEFHQVAARDEQCRLLRQLVSKEGPIHLELALDRLRQAWGLKRVGERMRRTLEEAVSLCESQQHLCRREYFLWPAREAPIAVRTPLATAAESRREVAHIPPEELQAGMRLLVSQGGGMSEEALLAQTARLFGFDRLGELIRQRLRDNLDALRQQGVFVARGEAITLTR